MKDKMRGSIYDIAIIGGGASGLIAAVIAGSMGASVCIVERLQKTGRKLLATGNGRCNFTNSNISEEHYFSSYKDFVRDVLRHNNSEYVIDYFRTLGVEPYEAAGGRIFPITNQASTILDVLRYEAARHGVEEKCGTRVKNILKDNSVFNMVLEDNSRINAKIVILAAGGRAAPKLGSDGSGYKLAKAFGHSVTQTFPALVQIRLDSPFLKGLKGVKIEGSIALEIDGSQSQRQSGELIFTDYGISGIPVLQLSRLIHPTIKNKSKLCAVINMFADYPLEEFESRIRRRLKNGSYKTVEQGMIGLLHKKLILPVIKAAGLDKNKLCGELENDEICRLISVLRNWHFTVTGTMDWKDAQVTAGGINLKEINSSTMESKLIKGLYFAGEIMDVDGRSGGYNLHWAWATGLLSGRSAAESIK